MDKRPIGVFDSGLGGLTVVREIRQILPTEDIVYLGDTARIPYGTRSRETVIKFALEDAQFLVKQNVKCLIIACNTASAFAKNAVKKSVQLPVFDVISAGSYDAVKKSKTKRIGVIGTRGTIGSQAYQSSILKLDQSSSIFSYPCPLFVPFIEEGEIKGKLIQNLVDRYLTPFKDKHIDTLVLGCTHYPIIEPLIKRRFNKVTLVNPGEFLAKKLSKFLAQHDLLNRKGNKGKMQYFVTDLTDRFVTVAGMFLGEKIEGRINKINLT